MTEAIIIESNDGGCYIKIIKSSGDTYSLELYVARYDLEEDCSYFIRALPDPAGKFSNIKSAQNEAERVIKSIG